MNTKLNNGLVMFLLFVMFLTGCVSTPIPDGEIFVLQTGSTLWVIRQAILEKPGSLMLTKGDLVSFMHVMDDGWAWVVVNVKDYKTISQLRDVGLTGNLANAKTLSDLTKFLMDNGWKVITSQDLPKYIIGIPASQMIGWAGQVRGLLFTFIYVPPALFDFDILDEYINPTIRG